MTLNGVETLSFDRMHGVQMKKRKLQKRKNRRGGGKSVKK